jgi:hypothetical protein
VLPDKNSCFASVGLKRASQSKKPYFDRAVREKYPCHMLCHYSTNVRVAVSQAILANLEISKFRFQIHKVDTWLSQATSQRGLAPMYLRANLIGLSVRQSKTSKSWFRCTPYKAGVHISGAGPTCNKYGRTDWSSSRTPKGMANRKPECVKPKSGRGPLGP